MPRGGARLGAGRPAGSLNKRSRELMAKLSGEETPVEFLMKVQHDEKEDKRLRIEAARAAAPYLHPKLSVIEESNAHPADNASLEQLQANLRATFGEKSDSVRNLLQIAIEANPDAVKEVLSAHPDLLKDLLKPRLVA